MQIDFYTATIDNYGDIGFSFNLAISLLYYYPEISIRYFSDNKDLFLKLKGNGEFRNIVYYDSKEIKNFYPSRIIFNFFDRKIDFEYLHNFGYRINIINFSYLLMHSGVKSLHGTSYVSKNVFVTHYIPSLLPDGGGIIINPYLVDFERKVLDSGIFLSRKEFLPNLDEKIYYKKWVSIFCYKDTFQKVNCCFEKFKDLVFFIFDNYYSGENVINMPFLNMKDYYKFQYLCDKNVVRGENSFVVSMLTGKPFLWDIYKENDNLHIGKIEDFSKYLLSKLSIFGSFEKYTNILKEFNAGSIEKGFEEFLDYENDFGKIKKIASSNGDLVRSVYRDVRKLYKESLKNST